MAAGSIEELLDLLYTEIEEAKNAPLSNDRCVVDRDRVLDMIDDVKAEMPVEIKRAKDIVAQRTDSMADAYDEVKHSRAQFRSALSALTGTKHTASSSSSRPQQAPKRAMYDAEADEDE